MHKTIIALLILPLASFAQSIVIEHVNISFRADTLEAKRLHLIEKQLGITRNDFEITCDSKFSGIAEIIRLPAEEVLLSSKIDGRKEKKYYTSVVLTDQQRENSIYRTDIIFQWFSQNYKKENKGMQTGATGRYLEESKTGWNRFEFPSEQDSEEIRTIWIFSVKDADDQLKPVYALRIKSESNQSR